MRIYATALALGLALNLTGAFGLNQASASTAEYNITLPGDGERVVEKIDIGGLEPGDEIAVFNLLAPSAGNLAALTIYTSNIEDATVPIGYDYDLFLDDVLQTWDPSSFSGYNYLLNVPLSAGVHEFRVSLKALRPGETQAPEGTTAEFFFQGANLPLPIPLPASGVLLIGGLCGLARLRHRARAGAVVSRRRPECRMSGLKRCHRCLGGRRASRTSGQQLGQARQNSTA